MELKVGDTAEVIEIIRSYYPKLYENGAWGTITVEFPSGACSAHIGRAHNTYGSTWYITRRTFRKVGKLTVKALKHG